MGATSFGKSSDAIERSDSRRSAYSTSSYSTTSDGTPKPASVAMRKSRSK